MEKPEQIGVAVGVLVNQQKSDALHWVRDVLNSAVEERKAWEDADAARKELAAAEAPEGKAASENPEAEPPRAPSICEYSPQNTTCLTDSCSGQIR
jgi:replication fork protection complex subunit Tof1/Swi1